MEDPHQGAHYHVADDFATYSPAESPSSLNSSFGHEGGLAFVPPPPPPKPSPRYRSKPPPGQKQWPPRGFKAPTLLTADPTEELGDSTSPETDWLSPASRGSNLDEYADPPTSKWCARPLEGGARQWAETSPRGGKISPRTKKLMERFGNLSQVREESEEEELRRKWQRVAQEEQTKRMGHYSGGEGFEQGERQEFRRYPRPVESRWYSPEEEMQSEEQRLAEEGRQQRWQELKQQQQQQRSRQLSGSDSQREGGHVRMVKKECWHRADGDSLMVKKECWVEETGPLNAEMRQVPQQDEAQRTTGAPAQRKRQIQDRQRVDSWHDHEQDPPGPSGSNHRMQAAYLEGPPAGIEGSRKSWAQQRSMSNRHYDSASEPMLSEEQRYARRVSPRSKATATFPRSEREESEWEARGWRREDFKGGTQQLASRGEEQSAELSFQENLRASIAQRWSEQASRELQSEGKSKVTSPASVASIEERVSKVGYVAKDEQIWVEESRISMDAHLREKAAGQPTAVSSESSPTRVAEAVDRLALMSLGWDEAMHNFHDLRGVKAVVKKVEDLLSPAPVGGGITLSGLAKKRSNSMPAQELEELKTPVVEEKPVRSLRRVTSDTEAEVVARTEPPNGLTRPPPQNLHSLPLSVAAIISPPAAPDRPRPPIARSDSYPPKNTPGMTSPTWSTPVTPVPILSTPPFAVRQMEPALTPRSQILQSAKEQGVPRQGSPALVPHPPVQASPHLPARRGSRGLLSPEQMRFPFSPPPPSSRDYDSAPAPFRRPSRMDNHSRGPADSDRSTPLKEESAQSRFASEGRAHQESSTSSQPASSGGASQLVVEEDCPICCEPLEVGRAMFAPECGHFVHFDCCRSNLLKGALDCPRCHQKMQEKPYLKTPYKASQNTPSRPHSAARSAH